MFYRPPEPDEFFFVKFQEFLQRYSSTKLSIMSFSWAILIFHKSTGLMAYKYIYLYFYLHLYNINIRKSDDWNLRRPSKRYRIVLNGPCFHDKDGKPMFNLINVNHSYV